MVALAAAAALMLGAVLWQEIQYRSTQALQVRVFLKDLVD
ncbi:hypothetical protein SAMCFNEI73_Ch0717 [Sinorhizobium americanum]|uniref:Uncharacterized protein n=1 Tax=Sinorhizobium americanum TaxID=194963 RepID=A0A1L3LIU3_9HYPH|nr:hypothetical protein SAMCCGM7_Ch0721 [Sinorhizobium americanum CCGM7]APG90042.1 hypothetical protein SAMCFNEI73_Ch0717 [Sinorhizobium americanum]TCN36497.1 hypothetical protein EV184_101489 [Sinorhizobium americanum]